jgi:hypothetical protein
LAGKKKEKSKNEISNIAPVTFTVTMTTSSTAGRAETLQKVLNKALDKSLEPLTFPVFRSFFPTLNEESQLQILRMEYDRFKLELKESAQERCWKIFESMKLPERLKEIDELLRQQKSYLEVNIDTQPMEVENHNYGSPEEQVLLATSELKRGVVSTLKATLATLKDENERLNANCIQQLHILDEFTQVFTNNSVHLAKVRTSFSPSVRFLSSLLQCPTFSSLLQAISTLKDFDARLPF